MEIVDSHCHLFLAEFDDDRAETLERARQAGVRRIVNVGLDGDSNRQVLAAHAVTPGLHPAVGWHPHNAGRLTAGDLDELGRLAGLPGVVALGEIGLDYFHGADSRQTQREALGQLLELACPTGLAVIIHCREAWDDFFDLLAPRRVALGDVLLHCFSGGPGEVARALDLGCHFSFSGAITFPKAASLRETITMIPRDRLLVETDAPYLAPVPRRGRRNEPALLAHSLETLAGVLGIGAHEAARLCSGNAIRLFGLSGPEL
jgi:TatD DNase family protein